MDRLKLFRFADFVYFVHEFCGMEGVTKEIQQQSHQYLLKSPDRNAPIGRMIHMKLNRRLRAISKCVDTDADRKLSDQYEWLAKSDRIVGLKGSNSADTGGGW